MHYGSKLKNAQNALNALEAVLQGTGKSFAQVDKAVVDYAKSIGQMSAQATTAYRITISIKTDNRKIYCITQRKEQTLWSAPLVLDN